MPEIKNMNDLRSSENTASKPAGLLQTVKTVEVAETANNHNGDQGRNGHLTSGRLLARNAVWNLLGNGAPMVVAVVCIPILIRGLGKERFGVLTLAWALIGYASLFDLGLGRALTDRKSTRLNSSHGYISYAVFCLKK